MTNLEVKEIQATLNRLGIRDENNNALAVDGFIGPLTISAIRNFQEREGIPVTGQVGPITTKAFRRRNPEFIGPGNAYTGYGRALARNTTVNPPDSVSQSTQLRTTNNNHLDTLSFGSGVGADVLGVASMLAGGANATNLTNSSNVFGAIGAAADVGAGIHNNVQAGTPVRRTVTDAIIDTQFNAGGLALSYKGGALAGPLAPLGAVGIGRGYNYLTNQLPIGGYTVREHARNNPDLHFAFSTPLAPVTAPLAISRRISNRIWNR